VLYDKVCRDDVLRIAYARVKANGGAPGIDHQTFEVIEKEIGVDTFLRSIQEQLLRGAIGHCRFGEFISRKRMARNARLASLSSPIV
jgi:hypothetical protein